MTATEIASQPTWAASGARAVRRLSAVTAAGGLLGLLVGGVGGRLAMMLLAQLNPDFTGRESDDGFTMGQFTGATFNLLIIATLLGVVGGAVYFVLRGLMVGPRWFQILSISVGPAVVVGSQIVTTDGIDFTLEPALLAVAMFVLIPGLYAALLTVVAERWLADDGPFARAPLWLTLVPLLLWAPIAPALGFLLLGLVAFEAVRRSDRGAAVLAQPVLAQMARAALVLVFALALVDLMGDVNTVA
jgi:hypothetical protein